MLNRDVIFGVRQTRTLLGPADPAQRVAMPARRPPATELIRRGGGAVPAGPDPVRPDRRGHRPPARARRRLLVAAGAAALVGVAAIAYPALRPDAQAEPAAEPEPAAEIGPVMVPMSYQGGDAPAAGHLRDLAAAITPAGYEDHTGTYAYHRVQTWGDGWMHSPDGYAVSYVEESETWVADDGSGRERLTQQELAFPDEASRHHWEGELDQEAQQLPRSSLAEYPAGTFRRWGSLPSDRASLAELLQLDDHAKLLSVLYGEYAPSRQVRADALEILADVPGLVWRGEVTDRAGRSGVAVSYDDQGTDPAGAEYHYRTLLVFDAGTGELLAYEQVDLAAADPTLAYYQLFLETDRTDSTPG